MIGHARLALAAAWLMIMSVSMQNVRRTLVCRVSQNKLVYEMGLQHFTTWPSDRHNDKLKEALIKYDRLLACRLSWATMCGKPRQANSLASLIRASFSLLWLLRCSPIKTGV